MRMLRSFVQSEKVKGDAVMRAGLTLYDPLI